MSLLDTIEIQGIRSVGVGPENANVIEFLTPLTIICGPNGTGKTTIIEALKYATTGELPPGRMTTFIHDLRLASRSRVDALVKLKFKDIRGRPCVITRRMTARAEGPKRKLTTKSEESTIAIEKEPGEMKSLSSKVIDTKKEILNLLGVPAAILDYVVFCHQEESTWPLDEPKKLKERFDEIFQVTGYVKAVETLKKVQKDNAQDLRVIEATLPHLLKHQEDKIKLNVEYKELEGKIEANEQDILAKENASKDLKKKGEELLADLRNAEKADRECGDMETELRVLQEQLDGSSTPDYQGTVEELKREIKAIEKSAEFVGIENDRKRLEDRINKISAKINDLTYQKEQTGNLIAELKAAVLMREKVIAEKSELTNDCLASFKFNADREIGEQLTELMARCKNETRCFQDELEKKLAVCQKELDSLHSDRAQTMNGIELREAECRKLRSAIEGIDNDLHDVASSSQQLEGLQQEIKAAEEELCSVAAEVDAQKKSDALKEERNNVATKIESLKKESRECEFLEETERNLKMKSEEAARFDGQLQSLVSKHKKALDEIFNGETIEHPVGEHVANMARKVAKAVERADQNLQKREREKNWSLQKVEQLKTQIDQITEEISTHKSRISKVCSSSDDVETRLEEERALLEKLRNDLGHIDGKRYLYEKWEEEIKQSKCCPLCERGYGSEEDVLELVKMISTKRSELPSDIRKLQRRVKEHEEIQKELMEVAPYVKITKKLINDKSELEEELSEAENKAHDLEKEVAQAQTEKNTAIEKQRMIQEVQADASLMDSFWKSLSELRRSIKLLKAEIDDDDTHRPLSDIRAELEECEKQQKLLLADIDALQNSIAERNAIVEKLNSLRARHLKLGEKAMQTDALRKSREDKERDLEEHTRGLETLKGKLPDLEKQLKIKLTEQKKLRAEGKAEEKRLLDAEREVDSAQAKLMSIEKRIEETQGDSDGLKKHEERLSEIVAAIETANEKVRILNGEIDSVNTKQDRKRRLDEQLKKLQLRERIESLNMKLSNSRWNGASIKELKKALSSIENELQGLMRDMERKMGEVEQQKARKSALVQQLKSRELQNAEEEYKLAVIKKCVTEKVIEDLAVYIRVVDESVVKFHAEKMEEINEVLAQLWEQVYRGNDIENIQIKSESVDENEKRKSYNYRVVMTVDGTEIDMPGRCSAGQKMLASILIRIALSDVFCDKCSIIALDEPTTNLDVLKVENLGDMLAQILQARSGVSHKNFQLIVITHDDRFVEHLRQLCRPEWVYALSKDSSGLSRIKRHRNVQEATIRDA